MRLCRALLIFSLLCVSRFSALAELPVDFRREIQPIFAEHCARCHGVDESSREAGLRLDQRSALIQGGDSGEAGIVAGDPSGSELIRRIMSDDPDYVMPPASENKPLSDRQKQALHNWILQGAGYAPHWAFENPRQVKPPQTRHAHPIDCFVASRLEKEGMRLSRPAEQATVHRRLHLDLVGLPPAPEDLDRLGTSSWEATIDRLLASERFGEKWARHWLDVARYSDTNGYEKDRRRDQWAWRDWVIDALNDDMPYDQFLIEQIAGDLLPDATQSQRIATGFLRNSMLNEEGAIIPEQFRMVEMFDRMDCIGKAVLGLTTQCAQCHTHKFDPLTQREYYGMFAFLNNAYEAQSYVYTDPQQRTLDEIAAQIGQLQQEARRLHPDWWREIAAWERQLTSEQASWKTLLFEDMNSISGLNHPVQLSDGSVLMLGHTSSDVFMVASVGAEPWTGLRIELLTHGDLPHRGPGRSGTGTWSIKEIEVLAQLPGQEEWQRVDLAKATADFSQPESSSDDGKRNQGPVKFLIDGSDDTAWEADRGPGLRNQEGVAAMQFAKPWSYPEGTRLKIAMRMNAMVGRCRFSVTTSSDPRAPSVAHRAMLAMQVPETERTDAQQQAIFSAWLGQQADCQELSQQIAAQWARTPKGHTTILHLVEREPAMRRDTHVLDRGEWDRPRKAVEPLTPAALHSYPGELPKNRLGFARWLASERSPLTARVAVNRIWQAIFGEGLVETPEDFGTRAKVPEYLELLDWLAVDFMQHGWSQKHLIKQIVTSEVYRQSSMTTEELLTRDPQNRLLARGPRFRAEAEVVRDIALSVSGLITHRVGGPPVIPPVPQNVLDYNYSYPGYWKPTKGPDRYRRTLYGFRKRSMPDPVMSSFDGPNGDSACVRRVRSNTPLAALAGLNETIFVEAARGLALRVLSEGGDDDTQRARYAFRLCTSRWPAKAEEQEVLQLLASRRKRIADGWLNAREIATGESGTLPDLPDGATPQDAAAWTLLSRVLLNLDETISKN